MPSANHWSFVHVNDFQLGTPRSYRFNPNINLRWEAIRKQIVALKPELMLVGGDLTRDGDVHEAEYQIVRDELDSLPFPSFVIPGNMDVEFVPGDDQRGEEGKWGPGGHPLPVARDYSVAREKPPLAPDPWLV